jgi:hypothetical protein
MGIVRYCDFCFCCFNVYHWLGAGRRKTGGEDDTGRSAEASGEGRSTMMKLLFLFKP